MRTMTEYVTTAQAAEKIGVTKVTIWTWIKNGVLRDTVTVPHSIGHGGISYLISADEVRKADYIRNTLGVERFYPGTLTQYHVPNEESVDISEVAGSIDITEDLKRAEMPEPVDISSDFDAAIQLMQESAELVMRLARKMGVEGSYIFKKANEVRGIAAEIDYCFHKND